MVGVMLVVVVVVEGGDDEDDGDGGCNTSSPRYVPRYVSQFFDHIFSIFSMYLFLLSYYQCDSLVSDPDL